LKRPRCSGPAGGNPLLKERGWAVSSSGGRGLQEERGPYAIVNRGENQWGPPASTEVAGLVENQARLIELLAEKRQPMIKNGGNYM